MFREIIGRVLLCVAWSALVVGFDLKVMNVGISSIIHTLLGSALGLLLVFRTNASYDRFWEGRRQWGNIVNDSRNLARQATSLLKDDPALLDRLVLWTMAWSWSLKHRLRGRKSIDKLAAELPAPEVLEVEQAQHVPLAVARKITETADAARRKGIISDVQQLLLDGSVQRLIDALGACERIHNTPLPFAYMVHLRRAMIVYLITLPMALVNDFGWATVPAILLISYVMLGVEEIGVEIEDPFGDDSNDLPLKTLCETIENNLQSLRPGKQAGPSSPQLEELKRPE